MGTRVKTFDATGTAPNGKLYAGDLNAIEDQYADLSNLAQTLGVGSIQVGETGLQIVRYGAGEMRITGAVRTDGIIRGLGGIYAGAFTTTQRDAIASGGRPYGLVILNTTTNRLEINLGSDPSPSWNGLGGGSTTRGTLGSRPGASVSNANSFYFATDDNGGTLYYSDGSVWTKVAKGITEAPVVHASSHLPGGSDAINWTAVLNYGTLASRPAASSTNTSGYYFATDDTGGILYQSNGSSWVQRSIGLSDSRLTNSRTPTAHAATHLTGGGDPLDFTQVNRSGTLAGRPAASSYPGQFYMATDANGGTLYQSISSAWVQVGLGVTQTPTIPAGTITSAMIVDGTITANDMAAGAAIGNIANGTLTSAMIADGTIANNDIANGTIDVGSKAIPGTAAFANNFNNFPTTGLFNGYRFCIYFYSGQYGWTGIDCIYRADIDSTYPWMVIGGGIFPSGWAGITAGQGQQWSNIAGVTLPRAGAYVVEASANGTGGGGGASSAKIWSNVAGDLATPNGGLGNQGTYAYTITRTGATSEQLWLQGASWLGNADYYYVGGIQVTALRLAGG